MRSAVPSVAHTIEDMIVTERWNSVTVRKHLEYRLQYPGSSHPTILFLCHIAFGLAYSLTLLGFGPFSQNSAADHC